MRRMNPWLPLKCSLKLALLKLLFLKLPLFLETEKLDVEFAWWCGDFRVYRRGFGILNYITHAGMRRMDPYLLLKCSLKLALLKLLFLRRCLSWKPRNWT
jgi:hypothetical protein